MVDSPYHAEREILFTIGKEEFVILKSNDF